MAQPPPSPTAQQPQFSQPEPEPPNVKFIECVCAAADSRADDNSSWTNIIREPIEITKGSELKIQTNFIDMRGIDGEIIEFQLDGRTQDNSHTLLTQMYTANDGCNAKTTSYDYIGSQDIPVTIDPGENYTTIANVTTDAANWVTDGNGKDFTGGVGSGFVMDHYAYSVRPKNITIHTGGAGYVNGTTFKVRVADPTTGGFLEPKTYYEGVFLTSSWGSVHQVILTMPVSHVGIPHTTGGYWTIEFGESQGSAIGLGIQSVNTTNGLMYSSINGTQTDAARGNGFQVGDSLWITEDAGGSAVDKENWAQMKLSQVYMGPGAVMTGLKQFDQGYNYEKAPVLRWDQTFDMTTKFSYGENTGTRTVQTHGTTVKVSEENTHQTNDPCLSSGKLITSKEDPFAPGIFHNDEQDRSFKINAPVIRITKDSLIKLTPNLTDGWTLTTTAKTIDINGNVVEASELNSMPQGAIYVPYFEVPGDTSPAALLAISDLQLSFSVPFRVQNVFQDGGRTAVNINSSLVDYVGGASNVIISQANLSPDGTWCGINEGPGTIIRPLVFNGAEDHPTVKPTEMPSVQINFGPHGATLSVEAAPTTEGQGCRTGMSFTVDYPGGPGTAPTDHFYVDQVDSTNGWRFPAIRKEFDPATDLVSLGIDISMYLVPTQQFSNWSENMKNKGNALEYREYREPAALNGIFPPTLTTGILSESPIASTGDVANGLYRPAGQLDPTNTFYESTLGALTNHDTNALLKVVKDGSTLEEANVSFGADGAAGVIVPYGLGGSQWYKDGDEGNYLRIDTAKWNTMTSNAPLPRNTYMTLVSATNSNLECHIVTGGSTKIPDITYTYIDILCPDVHMPNDKPVRTTKRIGPAGFMGIASGVILPIGGFANDISAWGAVDNANLVIKWVDDYKNHNTQITCQWSGSTGSVGVTGEANFFGNNDVNKKIMESKPLYVNQSEAMISSYDKGGYYFLTHFIDGLSVKGGNVGEVSLTEENTFNQGLMSWNTAMLPAVNYAWRPDYQAPTEYNYQQSMSSIGGLWDYYDLYRQKTFIIDKAFCVASDISGLWTRQAHALGGAINPTDGTQYVDSTQTGIIQNEFIMPVYGSNNRIGPDGKYELLDKVGDVYEHTGGLEPGHCVGKNYVNDDCNWLSGALMAQLPKDVNNNSFYFIFFRTAFTRYRGYDPLASDPALPDLPDFTPLTTVGLQAHSIGNANKPATVNGGPLVTPIQKYLDGTDTLASHWAVNPPTANVPTDEIYDYFAYELGPPQGISWTPGPPNPPPTGNGPGSKFGQRGYYPIFYLDRTKAYKYDKAKISQYVGSQNLALAFATDISTFTFQFLHSPFTAPFVDGEGGQIATRVFFGNRREGIYNHEVFGGVVVANYARPDFPLNTFTETEIKNNTVFTEFPNGIDPLKSVGRVGLNFMNKIGFTDADIGVRNGKLISGNTELGYSVAPYTRDISSLLDGTFTLQFTSNNTKWYGTTGSDIDTSDAILTQIPPPEENPGIESNNQEVVPRIGTSNTILRKFGDYIFYPYSYSSDSSSFKDSSIVRFDNASSTYGAVGGMLMSNSNRGMGLPNTLGSTFITDDTSVPRTLNPDCELYLAYTIECSSSLKRASLLPVKLNNGYLMILSSLMRETNLYMPNAGFVNAMSIVNFTFLQGDYILSQGEMSFYAKEDFILSEITTSIRDTNFGTPSSLGKNSSVIYSITDYNPKPKMEIPTISQIQDQDMEIMQMVQSHQAYLQGQSSTSALQELHSDLYSLGINTLTHKNDVDVIGAIRNQINTHDIANLTANERIQFLRTPEGENFLQNVHDAQVMHQQIGILADAQNDLVGEFGGILGQQRQEKITRDAEREISIRERGIRGRTPLVYFQPNDPIDTPPPPDRRRNVERFVEFRTTKHEDLLGKVFYSKDQRDTADDTMTGFTDRVKAITKGKRGRPTRDQTAKIKEIGEERSEYLKSLRDKLEYRSDIAEERTPRDRGIGAIRRGGYTPEDIDAMERFQAGMREEERLTDIRQQIQQANVVSPSKKGDDDSGVGTMPITRRGSEEKY